MRILVLHAWLKGNLGDVLQLSVLLSALRELNPRVLDLAGYPPRPARETGELLKLADRFLPDPFPWYWNAAPAAAGALIFEPRWRKARKSLFSRYDAIVAAPGPYLADYDRRVTSAVSDIVIATELGLPVVLASHSIGPLSRRGLAGVAKATLRVARERSTFEYLRERGIPSVLSADYAFLYPYGQIEPRITIEPPYRLLFLRANNLDALALRIQNGALFEGSRLIAAPTKDTLVLATSDYRRDARFLAKAARKLRVRAVHCRSVAELVQLIGASAGVVTDRYHPAICAATLGKPAQIVPNREPHKMHGLQSLLAASTITQLQELARAGLRSVRDTLQREA
jgi:polysaccharide pyruvyl transferase WcaK-like protein